MKTITNILMLTALATVFCCLQALADELSVEVTNVSVIANPTNSAEQNVLLSFEIPACLSDADIHDAELVIKPSFDSTKSGYTDILVYPFRQQMSLGSASWSFIYDNARYLLDIANGTHETTDGSGDGLMHINITYWLAECLNGDVSNFGFLLTPGSPRDEGFTLSEDDYFSAGSSGVVKVIYFSKP